MTRVDAGVPSFAVALAALLACAGTVAARETAGDKATAYVGARLIDGTGARAQRGLAIVVRGERIEAIVPDKDAEADKDLDVVDVRGQFVLPGLINAHVHLATPPDRARALAMMRRMVHGGVTAVRSMGDDARVMSELARAAQLGEVPGPDIAYAALFAGPSFFTDPRVVAAAKGALAGDVPWLRSIVADTDLREAVTLSRGSGASAIKIYANLDGAQVSAIAAEAHRQGLQAWAHAAVFPAAPMDVASSGVDSVSHVCMVAYQGQDMPAAYHDRPAVDESRFVRGIPDEVRDVFRRMRERGVILDVTNYVYETIERMRAELPEGQGPPTYCSSKLSERLTAEAHRLGVEIAVGTDAFAPPDEAWPAVQREMEILVDAGGMTPLQAIRSATLVGARSMGRESDMGTIAAGKLANLVFVASDPSANIRALRQVTRVVKRGKTYLRKDYVPITADPRR